MAFNIGRDRVTLSIMLTPGGLINQLTPDCHRFCPFSQIFEPPLSTARSVSRSSVFVRLIPDRRGKLAGGQVADA